MGKQNKESVQVKTSPIPNETSNILKAHAALLGKSLRDYAAEILIAKAEHLKLHKNV